MSFYNYRSVVVLGGCGLIGRHLIDLLLVEGARVRVVDIVDPRSAPLGVEYHRLDLRQFNNCLVACSGCEIVFNLVGVKGSPKMAVERPATFFVPMLMIATNAMEAARRAGADRFLYTSSIGVYDMKEPVLREDSVATTFPSKGDWYPGWAKRMGELQAEAYAIEYGWDKISVVRPANVYGAYDNFDPENAMVIPSLIARCADGERPLKVWGDGSAYRDFIHAHDAAKAMMLVVEKGYNKPVNIGSGQGVSIKTVAETIANSFDTAIEWDTSKPSGDPIRVLEVERLNTLGFTREISLEEGIAQTIDWYLDHGDHHVRYNIFRDLAYKD